MAENMFEIRKNDRRKQIIEENLDVADQILSTNPNLNILQNESEIDELQEEVVDKEKLEVIEQKENQQEQLIETEDSPVQFKLSLLKREKIKKDTYNYYLEDSIDDLAGILSNTMEISKSEVVSLLLKSAILTNEDIQGLAEINEEVKKLLEKLKK